MSEAGPAIARFDFSNGPLRGSHLMLYSGCLVHRGEGLLETLPLAGVASARVAFERNPRRLVRGAALIVVALVLVAISAPIAAFAGAAANEMAAAGGQGVAPLLRVAFRLLGLGASLLPVLAAVSALGGIAIAVLGWLGDTVLTLTSGGYERVYPARGRNAGLLDFAELLSEQLMSPRR